MVEPAGSVIDDYVASFDIHNSGKSFLDCVKQAVENGPWSVESIALKSLDLRGNEYRITRERLTYLLSDKSDCRLYRSEVSFLSFLLKIELDTLFGLPEYPSDEAVVQEYHKRKAQGKFVQEPLETWPPSQSVELTRAKLAFTSVRLCLEKYPLKDVA